MFEAYDYYVTKFIHLHLIIVFVALFCASLQWHGVIFLPYHMVRDMPSSEKHLPVI